ncbi:MAG: nuclear transport factor 2 family protein [Saprospiraceae bacterium]|jgi:ketosteroid isomerase-like protein|nr:nuclear transport factor 2 family protein [Saprospiraceae bacterium]MBK9994791.1 nuclear transport factor 2 family protein [Saprospiraceae bacterium]
MSNKQIIENFYRAFAASDIEGMLSCYHDKIQFEDPAFGKLEGDRAKNMWRMLLLSSNGEIKLSFSNVEADETSGSAYWIAEYYFSKTGRKVINHVQASFHFQDGLIIKHKDQFSLYKWAKQALGMTGVLIGWSSFFKHKMQKGTNTLLDNFMRKNAKM